MKYDIVLFDLDGVIVESGIGISKAVNTSLQNFNLPPIDDKKVINFIGNGAKRLIQDVLVFLNIDITTMKETKGVSFETFFDWYLACYERMAVESTPLYTGAKELLQELNNLHIPLGLVTSKPLAVTKVVLAHYEIDSCFDAIICPEMVTNLKPHPESLERALKIIQESRNIKVELDNVLMIGDSASDIKAAQALGCKSCAVTGGIGDTEKLLAQNANIVVELAGDLLQYF